MAFRRSRHGFARLTFAHLDGWNSRPSSASEFENAIGDGSHFV